MLVRLLHWPNGAARGIEAGRPSNYRREMAVIFDQLDALAVAVVNFIERRGGERSQFPLMIPLTPGMVNRK